MHGRNGDLHRPQWVTDTFSQLVDDLVEQQTSYLDKGATSQDTGTDARCRRVEVPLNATPTYGVPIPAEACARCS